MSEYIPWRSVAMFRERPAAMSQQDQTPRKRPKIGAITSSGHRNTCDLIGYQQGYNTPAICSCDYEQRLKAQTPDYAKVRAYAATVLTPEQLARFDVALANMPKPIGASLNQAITTVNAGFGLKATASLPARSREQEKRDKWYIECERLGIGLLEESEDWVDADEVLPESAVDVAFAVIDALTSKVQELQAALTRAEARGRETKAASDLLQRIKRWREDDEAGYDQAIDLLIAAETELEGRETRETALEALIAKWRTLADVQYQMAQEFDAKGDSAGNAHACMGRGRIYRECADALEDALRLRSEP
jgi:hypothetical protein